jgi:hypothetical protein
MAKSKIIKDFARESVNIVSVLKQLKVLLSDLDGADKAKEWINHELSGYSKDDELPEYRKTGGNLKGTFMNYTLKVSNVNIPLVMNTPEDISEPLHTIVFYESLPTLAELKKNASGIVRKEIGGDFYPLLMKYAGVSMTAPLGIWVESSDTAISEVISKVEEKTLDILLYLEKEFGSLDNLELDLSEKNEDDLKHVVYQINVLIYGDHSINIGDNNKITKSEIKTE